MKIFEKIIELLGSLLPFLKKKKPEEMKEFTSLIQGQYRYLLEIIQTFQQDYFELSERLKLMNEEILSLNRRLGEALQQKCSVKECSSRK